MFTQVTRASNQITTVCTCCDDDVICILSFIEEILFQELPETVIKRRKRHSSEEVLLSVGKAACIRREQRLPCT